MGKEYRIFSHVSKFLHCSYRILEGKIKILCCLTEDVPASPNGGIFPSFRPINTKRFSGDHAKRRLSHSFEYSSIN
jgi:hypothetical protein